MGVYKFKERREKDLCFLIENMLKCRGWSATIGAHPTDIIF